MNDTTLTPMRLARRMLILLPFLALPFATMLASVSEPPNGKGGAGLVLLVSLQRTALQ